MTFTMRTSLPIDMTPSANILDLRNRNLRSIPEGAMDNITLQQLNLSSNRLTSLPERIGNLTQLERLLLSKNLLTRLPETIGSFTQLQRLYLSSNQLKSVPTTIRSLAQLHILNLYNNHIKLLPEEIGNLVELRVLNFSKNQIKLLPETMGNLVQLQVLDLSDNQLTSLPETMGNLTQLQRLYLQRNQLASLPETVENLVQLRGLYLQRNRLTSLPATIGSLVQLKGLSLQRNRLTSLPETIGNLVQLKGLSLQRNRLTSFPAAMRNLQDKLTFLDLRENPLLRYGEGNALGWWELERVFANKPAFQLHVSYWVRTLGSSYRKMHSTQSPRWNMKEIRKLRLDQVPKHKLSDVEIVGILENKLGLYLPDQELIEKIVSYIRSLYGTDGGTFKGWRMYEELVESTKDLVEAIFKMMEKNDVIACLREIEKAMEYPPDRQIAVLNRTYYANKNDIRGSFEAFVGCEIAGYKSYILGIQKAHPLNYRTRKFRDDIDIDAEYKSQIMEALDQDPFENRDNEMSRMFYKEFMPRYVMSKLVMEINSSQKRLNEAKAFLMDVNVEYRGRAFTNEGSVGDLSPLGITESGVEEILQNMRILVRDEDTESWIRKLCCI